MSSLQQWNIAIGEKKPGLGILVGGLNPSEKYASQLG
jgi:hypothetical protein